MATWIATLLLSIVIAKAAGGSSVHDDLSKFEPNLSELQDQIPADLLNGNLTNKWKKVFQDKCTQVAGEENGNKAYAEIEAGLSTLGECITSNVNFADLQDEIDKASPKGELDVVFNKYCKRRDNMTDCIRNFTQKLTPCLEIDEQATKTDFMRIVNSLFGFICHKGGDQIALFIAEKGPECLTSKQEEIKQCINSTYSPYIPEGGLDHIDTLPKLVIGETQCKDIQELEDCVVKHLETCSEITPANIVESMFRFIRNETICRSTGRSMAAKVSSGASNLMSFSIILYCMFMLVERYVRT